MTAKKHDETENAFSIDDNDTQQLSLILKYFVRIRENEDFVVKADFEKNEIQYYYNDNDDFSAEKEINFLNKFLKAAKSDQEKWLNPEVGVYYATFNYSEIICEKNLNFMSRIEIRR